MYKDMWKQLMCYMIPVIDHMFKGVIFSLQLNIGDNEVLINAWFGPNLPLTLGISHSNK